MTPSQSQTPQYIFSPWAPNVPTAITATDDMYWAAQPLPVQTLRNMAENQGVAAASALAHQLAAQGYAIDFLIMIYGWPPITTMAQRFIDGLTWVPRLDGQGDFTNSIINPGVNYDPKNPPPGAIKVSVSASDYPPVVPPTPKPVTPTNIIGAQVAGMPGVFYPGPGTMNNIGQPIFKYGDTQTVNGVVYVAGFIQVGLGFNEFVWRQQG